MEILCVSDVIKLTGLSRSTLWRLEKGHQFPQPLQLSPNRVGWRNKDIEAWLADCPRRKFEIGLQEDKEINLDTVHGG